MWRMHIAPQHGAAGLTNYQNHRPLGRAYHGKLTLIKAQFFTLNSKEGPRMRRRLHTIVRTTRGEGLNLEADTYCNRTVCTAVTIHFWWEEMAPTTLPCLRSPHNVLGRLWLKISFAWRFIIEPCHLHCQQACIVLHPYNHYWLLSHSRWRNFSCTAPYFAGIMLTA